MFEIVAAWVVAGFLGGHPGPCSVNLQDHVPNVQVLPSGIQSMIQTGVGDGLDVVLIDDHKLMVISRRLDLPDLALNGNSAKFSWHDVNGVGVVLLEQCGLAHGALSLMAGSEYMEWVSPDFFESRPETESEAASLRTLSLSSEALGRDREVYLVIPEGWNGSAGHPLLVSGDGLAGSSFGAIVETLVASGQSRPVAFASARFGEGMPGNAGIPLRSAEYHLPGDSASEARRAAYAAHEKFFFDEFLPSVIQELGGETGPIYTFGISSSASFALEQALMRGDLIAGVIAASPPIHSRTRELANQIKTTQKIRLWCGTLEDQFCNPIRELAEAQGYPLETRQASHISALWEEALSASIIELFPPGN